jgi:hypothetical protein
MIIRHLLDRGGVRWRGLSIFGVGCVNLHQPLQKCLPFSSIHVLECPLSVPLLYRQEPPITLQLRKLGKSIILPRPFSPYGVFIRQGYLDQIALQSGPLERATHLRGVFPWYDWLLKAIQPCLHRDF